MTLKLLVDARSELAESPAYDAETGRIWWIEIRARRLCSAELDGSDVRSWPLPDEIGGFCLAADGRSALVALRTGLHRLDLEGGDVRLLVPPPFDPDRFRFNEADVDPDGRFWIGVMFDPRPGVRAERGVLPLHSWRSDEGFRVREDESDLHNGVAFGPDRRFYVSHTHERRIYAYDLDGAAGRLSGRRLFAEVEPGVGVPDGAAVDAEGCYWCALHGGGRLRRYTPDGHVDGDLPLPVSQPTMCAFVGPDLDRLVVTSARQKLSPEALERQPEAGGLLILDPGVRGRPKRLRCA